ncbi:NrfD/PsrC family molybdoenzyme membrane anchor subunit [Wohlfahrtiimonas chitiniclastica]|uniref:Polysulfide reductase NrfD n=1 Tax=Wohlfahrtiimonas chitiniclastica TaxID=400946 RepID=A0AB35C0Y2_9GAMM|nr:NrfD/PsrC family molybdoenzyme membrane anchor subunit [Wohlfahrtiimonas chitiniclastica]MBS7815759.1 polysulfide reductase NrfD [Wohlfahrtiimonas chitiniclastica]MBS7823327.1 polysulfide reductase NrfD [Wohlfahrtiimonas chitiniclastica]MBS7825036.1 polysulfide reductase NrfD [Wohlfahrtiimonas chitiniclastica]MBS7831111.1 polysulfide reductase NrfD [Wohlfahrtiimonas chitiniclastica]MBS7833078.1 polysulfide reductase NrfD [Wohlfahrtiimonas chitiniclastica]
MIRELLTHPQELAWLPWAVQYFFFIGIAATGALIAVYLRLFHRGQYRLAELITLAIAVTTGIVGPIALSADLHQPGRILNFYLSFTPWSWMWIGAIIVPFFVVFLLAQFLLVLRENTDPDKLFKGFKALHWFNFNESKILPWTGICLALFAFGILLYTGKEVNIVQAQAIWHTPWLPWVLFFTALQTLPMLVKTWQRLANITENDACLTRIQFIALSGVLVTLVGWGLSETPAGAAFRSLPEQGSVWFTIGLGLVVYWVSLMLFTVLTWTNKRTLSPYLYLLLSLMSLSLAWTIRWAILMQAQTLPKYNIFINPYHLSWGFDGALGIISTFGLWITLLIIVWSLLNDRWFTFKGAHHG